MRDISRAVAGPQTIEVLFKEEEFTSASAAPGVPKTSPRQRALSLTPDDTEIQDPSHPAWKRSLAAHLAFLGAVNEVSSPTRRISSGLFRLKSSRLGIAGSASGIFTRYIGNGEEQLQWIEANLAAVTRLSCAATDVDDPDMQLALLRLAGPRLESAMLGSLLLTTWPDFLNPADVAIKQRIYSLERLFVDLGRVQEMLHPSMTALASSDPVQLAAIAEDAPALAGHLTREFAATRESMRVGAGKIGKLLVLKEAVDTLTLLSVMRFSLPSLSPAAPATLGRGMMVGNSGVMMGTRVVVSVEWVELMRHLVQVGVISTSLVSAIVRIQAGHVLLAQAHGELPSGVREALGDGPEVSVLRQAEAQAGRMLPPEAVLKLVAREMRRYRIPMNFVVGRTR